MEELKRLYSQERFTWIKFGVEIGISFLSVFGILWLFMEPLSFFDVQMNGIKSYGIFGYLIFIMTVLLIAIVIEISRKIFFYFKIYQETKRILENIPSSTDKLKILTTTEELIRNNIEIVKQAQKILVATGSRSRDPQYFQAIEQKLLEEPRLTYIRVLYGFPHHEIFKKHLHNLIKKRDPRDLTYGYQTLCIGIAENFLRDGEKFICANESLALVVLPSLNGYGHHDTALLIENSLYVEKLIRYVQEMYSTSKTLETKAEIDALSVMRSDDIPTRGA